MFELSSIKQLFSEEKVHKRIRELAKDIYGDYEQRNEDFWMLYLEKGARVFAEKLQQEIVSLDIPLHGRYQGIMSMTASRTKGTGFMDEVALNNFYPEKIKGKNILLVEDLVDHGLTLDVVLARIKGIVASCLICVLIDKVKDRKKPIKIDYAGFQVTEGWVVGFGMDVAEQGRDLPFIGVIEPIKEL